MPLEVALPPKRFATRVALEVLLAQVDRLHMLLEVVGAPSRIAARVALEVLLAQVDRLHMCLEGGYPSSQTLCRTCRT